MNEHERFDLSALSTEQDPDHWHAFVGATLMRVDAALTRRAEDPLSLIASWTRPLLIAAAVAVMLLVPVEIVLETREARAEQVQRLVALSTEWGRSEAPPSGTDFLQALAEQGRP